MTDTIAHNGRTYTMAENIYSAKIDGDPVAEANLRWVEENLRCVRLPYSPAGDQAAVDAHTWKSLAQAVIIEGPHSRWCYLLTEGRPNESPNTQALIDALVACPDAAVRDPVAAKLRASVALGVAQLRHGARRREPERRIVRVRHPALRRQLAQRVERVGEHARVVLVAARLDQAPRTGLELERLVHGVACHARQARSRARAGVQLRRA